MTTGTFHWTLKTRWKAATSIDTGQTHIPHRRVYNKHTTSVSLNPVLLKNALNLKNVTKFKYLTNHFCKLLNIYTPSKTSAYIGFMSCHTCVNTCQTGSNRAEHYKLQQGNIIWIYCRTIALGSIKSYKCWSGWMSLSLLMWGPSVPVTLILFQKRFQLPLTRRRAVPVLYIFRNMPASRPQWPNSPEPVLLSPQIDFELWTTPTRP